VASEFARTDKVSSGSLPVCTRGVIAARHDGDVSDNCAILFLGLEHNGLQGLGALKETSERLLRSITDGGATCRSSGRRLRREPAPQMLRAGSYPLEQFRKQLRSGRKQPDQNRVALRNSARTINGLAQNSIGYRYTIPQDSNENSLVDSIA
jgi:hypothetical protein